MLLWWCVVVAPTVDVDGNCIVILVIAIVVVCNNVVGIIAVGGVVVFVVRGITRVRVVAHVFVLLLIVVFESTIVQSRARASSSDTRIN